MIYVCIDFDGTIVKHECPRIGQDIGAIPWLKQAQDMGAKLILHTMRWDNLLNDAIEYCTANGLEIFAANENPTQRQWTTSKKVHGHIYIDDTALGVPRIANGRWPYVDWEKAGPMLIDEINRLKGV